MSIKIARKLQEDSQALSEGIALFSGKKTIPAKDLGPLVAPCLEGIKNLESQKALSQITVKKHLAKSYTLLSGVEKVLQEKAGRKKPTIPHKDLQSVIQRIHSLAMTKFSLDLEQPIAEVPTEANTEQLETDFSHCKQNLEGYLSLDDLDSLEDFARGNILDAKRLVKQLKDISKKETLSKLIAALEKKLGPATTAVVATEKKGSINRGGNDCFINAFYQFVQTKEIQDHFIAHLPEELWEVFATTEPNSTLMRKRLVEETSFGETIRTQLRVDPYSAQLDSTEVLNSLFLRIYHKDHGFKEEIESLQKAKLEKEKKALAEAKSKKEEEAQEADNGPKAVRPKKYFLLYFVIKIFDQLSNAISFFTRNLFFGGGGGDDLSLAGAPAYVDPATIAEEKRKARERRPLLSTETPHPEQNNPLFYTRKLTLEYRPEQDVPEALIPKAKDMWGGACKTTEVGHSEKIDTVPYIPLNFVKTGAAYKLPEMFREGFRSTNNEPSSMEANGITYKAKMTMNYSMENPPEGLMLSLARMEYVNGVGKKINDPVEDIETKFVIDADLTEDKVARTYELKSFITHKGTGTSSGHYVAYRKEIDPTDNKEAWFLFNDGSPVIKVPEKDVKDAVKHSYVLFYKKT